MRVRFNGMFATKSGGGCACHGGSKSKRTFLAHKTFILPSGQTRSFSVTEEYEVSDLDGNFLLSYSQLNADGVRQDAFTRLD